MKGFCLLLICIQLAAINAFSNIGITQGTTASKRTFNAFALHEKSIDQNESNAERAVQHRRTFVKRVISSTAGATLLSFSDSMILPNNAFAKTAPDVNAIVSQLNEARAQLNPVPKLIKEQKWDAVRAILSTPPLVDCWGKTPKPLLKMYAQAQDDLPNGDELAALELKEEALDHFRFLDMAVYNNVFNPIGTEGENGATKELIRSYYEDPVREYEACVKILDDLIALAAK